MPTVIGYDQTTLKRKTCSNCGAVNEYKPSEVRVLNSGRDISGVFEAVYGFNCAGCGAAITTKVV